MRMLLIELVGSVENRRRYLSRFRRRVREREASSEGT
jgi:hypothetical protein